MSHSTPDIFARKSRVFLVDDHPLVRDGLATLINQQADVVVCGDAEDATSALRKIATTRPHLALIDISLKLTSGLELIKDLRIQHPAVAVVVLSMHDEMLYAERALRAGARGYVMKRESTQNVLTAIRRVLEGGVYLSDRVVAAMALRLGGRRSSDEMETAPVQQLSDRELEIFRLLGQGRSTLRIADDLHLSLKTVQAYCARAKEKLGINTALELRRLATRWEDAHAAEIA
jgi:DNA-binding NarL/FixJ family response regulator